MSVKTTKLWGAEKALLHAEECLNSVDEELWAYETQLIVNIIDTIREVIADILDDGSTRYA